MDQVAAKNQVPVEATRKPSSRPPPTALVELTALTETPIAGGKGSIPRPLGVGTRWLGGSPCLALLTKY